MTLKGYILKGQKIARGGKPKPSFMDLFIRPKLNWRWKIEPEQKDCIAFADELRLASKEKRLKAVWLHIPNEGKRHQIVACIMKAMGMLSGAPDYVFAWENGSGFIEFKNGNNKLTGWQEAFREWVELSEVYYAVCRSPEEALKVLKKWGVLV